MKNKKPARIFVVLVSLTVFALLIASILFLIASCENKEDEFYVPPEVNILELEDTGKLVVYSYGWSESGIRAITKSAINFFKVNNNAVEVEYKEFIFDSTFNVDSFREMLMGEVLAGQGPDLIIGEKYLFDDIYKVMDSGVFFDLNETINTDPDFNLSLYTKAVMDSGIYKGRRYIMPIDYRMATLVTINEELEQEGINFNDFSTLDGFLDAVIKFMSNNSENYDTYPSLYNPALGELLTFSGLKIIDYENRQVDFSDPVLKKIVDVCKDVYTIYENNPDREFSSYYEGTGGIAMALDPIKKLQEGRILYNMLKSFSLSDFYYYYSGLMDSSSPVFTSFPAANGGTCAAVDKFAGIRSTSENKKNAYHLMKILLSSDIQGQQSSTESVSYIGFEIPVLTEAARSAAENEWGRRGNPNGRNDGSVVFEDIPVEIHEKFIDLVVNIDSCVLETYSVTNDFLIPGLEPYFKGEKTYEECIEDLTYRLTIYLSE
ncbi:MAG: hypothetical protein ACYCWE_21470 [Eubacteriales bacterium]